MKVTARSTFHPGHEVVFVGIEAGRNIRRLRGRRSQYCLDYSHNNSHVCGCGFPTGRTDWVLPQGYVLIADPHECGPDGDPYGRGYISISIDTRASQYPACVDA